MFWIRFFSNLFSLFLSNIVHCVFTNFKLLEMRQNETFQIPEYESGLSFVKSLLMWHSGHRSVWRKGTIPQQRIETCISHLRMVIAPLLYLKRVHLYHYTVKDESFVLLQMKQYPRRQVEACRTVQRASSIGDVACNVVNDQAIYFCVQRRIFWAKLDV